MKYPFNIIKVILFYIILILFTCVSVSLTAAKKATPVEIQKITEAIPATIQSAKKYKILVFSKAFTYYHSSIAVAKEMAKQMGEKTGLFEAVFTDDPKDLSAENLKNYDTVYLNNSTSIEKGLTTEKMRKEFIEYVRNGGGLVAIHAATDGGWPGYTDMVGGNFNGHPWGHEGTYCICNEDPEHPIVSGIFDGKQSFNLNDELYQYKDFDRKKVRVLFQSICRNLKIIGVDERGRTMTTQWPGSKNLVRVESLYPVRGTIITSIGTRISLRCGIRVFDLFSGNWMSKLNLSKSQVMPYHLTRENRTPSFVLKPRKRARNRSRSNRDIPLSSWRIILWSPNQPSVYGMEMGECMWRNGALTCRT